MQYSRRLRVDLQENIPADIHSAYLRNQVSVQFEQTYMRHSAQTEPSYDDLITWCESHCMDVFSAVKWASTAAQFAFYLADDRERFESYLAESVAKAAGSTT
jgi:hypothetical protein